MREITEADIEFVKSTIAPEYTGVISVDTGNRIMRFHFFKGEFSHSNYLTGQNAIRLRAYLSHTFIALPELEASELETVMT